MLEKMIKCQNDLKVDLVICGYYVEEKNKSISYCMEKNQMLDNVTLMEKVYVPAEINGVVWNKLFSRRLLYNEDGEPTDLYIAFMRIGGLLFMFASIIFSVVCFA